MSVETQLRLYNTLTRSKEAFAPIDPGNVRMYVCGPTVYDFAHIGNARPVIVFDVLYRLLRHIYGPDHVTYVRNITDVDDKINDRAVRDFPDLPLNEAIRRVTETTANQYMEDVSALGCLEPTHQPRATDNIAQMITIIQSLLDKNFAYVASGKEGREVLFAVSAMPDYGKLSNRKLDEQQSGARVAVEEHKRNAADFVLWKESAADQPGWDGRFTFEGADVAIHGRPGWHIECSAMSNRYLGETFDIHGGGLDLIFPHHENEIAQNRCAFGHDVMANVWMHNGFLQVEGEKMSKSLGNFVTINELLATEKFGGRKWPGEVLRLTMLRTHYRQPIDWTIASLEESEKMLARWRNTVRRNGYRAGELSHSLVEKLSDDINTHAAITTLQADGARANGSSGLQGVSVGEAAGARLPSEAEMAEAGGRLIAGAAFLGFDLLTSDVVATDLTAKVDSLIAARLEARRTKNFAESDRIRDELVAMGIQIMDAKDPVTGELTTRWEVKR